MVNNVGNDVGQLHDVALGNPNPQPPQNAWAEQINPNDPQQGVFWTPKKKKVLAVALVIIGIVAAIVGGALGGLPIGIGVLLGCFLFAYFIKPSATDQENRMASASSAIRSSDVESLPDGGPDSQASYGSEQEPVEVSQQNQDDYDLHLPGRNDIPADDLAGLPGRPQTP